jgi:biotin carboxyl carrier protein
MGIVTAQTEGGVAHSLDWDGESPQATINGNCITIDRSSKQKNHWIIQGRSFTIDFLGNNEENGEVELLVNGRKRRVKIITELDNMLKQLGMSGGHSKQIKDLKAPMPGLVLKVLVEESQIVEKDTPLMILEAMKMENVIKSPVSGKIAIIKATQGRAVEKNEVLLSFA